MASRALAAYRTVLLAGLFGATPASFTAGRNLNMSLGYNGEFGQSVRGALTWKW